LPSSPMRCQLACFAAPMASRTAALLASAAAAEAAEDMCPSAGRCWGAAACWPCPRCCCGPPGPVMAAVAAGDDSKRPALCGATAPRRCRLH
jgi:hypothetical protein